VRRASQPSTPSSTHASVVHAMTHQASAVVGRSMMAPAARAVSTTRPTVTWLAGPKRPCGWYRATDQSTNAITAP
jgi:hypothetical protein